MGSKEHTPSPATSDSTSHYFRYIIIGGGVSGLSAAHHLAVNGENNFLILEGRNRLGGRILSKQIGNTMAELGASYLHGILGNPLYEIASANKLVERTSERMRKAIAKPHNVVAILDNSTRIQFTLLQEVYEAYYWFFKRCEEHFNRLKFGVTTATGYGGPLIPSKMKSVGQHIEFEIDLYLRKFKDERDVNIRRSIFDYLLKRECCITGSHSMHHVDLISLGSYQELPGGNVSLPYGYSSVLKPILSRIPPENIRLNHTVSNINWKYVSNDSSLAKVKVECSNGDSYICNHVLSSFPLGVLKHPSSTNLFTPPLPQSKLDALKKLSFGTVNKIFLSYEKPFIWSQLSEIILLWRRGRGEDPYPSCVDMKNTWFRHIYSFCKLSDTLLVAWISGEASMYMESLDMTVVADTCTAILRKFLGDHTIPRPKSCIFTAWKSQKFSRGSYSWIGVGGSQDDIVCLAEPIVTSNDPARTIVDVNVNALNSSPVLSLIGEHCHPSFYSTGHGAYLSGRDSAKFLLSWNSQVKKSDELLRDSCGRGIESASVQDLSSWLSTISIQCKGSIPSAGYQHDLSQRYRRDDGRFYTPR